MDERKLRSKKQESKVAKELGGKTTPASGALWGAKADVRNDIFLVECKTTKRSYYSLTHATWNKIYHEATKDGLRIPVMCIDLNDGKTRLAVMRTVDIGNYPPSDSFYNAYTNRGNSYRVKNIARFVLMKTGNSPLYDLQSLPWDDFLETVTKEYEKENENEP